MYTSLINLAQTPLKQNRLTIFHCFRKFGVAGAVTDSPSFKLHFLSFIISTSGYYSVFTIPYNSKIIYLQNNISSNKLVNWWVLPPFPIRLHRRRPVTIVVVVAAAFSRQCLSQISIQIPHDGVLILNLKHSLYLTIARDYSLNLFKAGHDTLN